MQKKETASASSLPTTSLQSAPPSSVSVALPLPLSLEKIFVQDEKAIMDVICQFVNGLFSIFGQKYRWLTLYHGMVKRGKQELIPRHVKIFTDFLVKNKPAIEERDFEKIEGSIFLTTKIYINLKILFVFLTNSKDRDNIKTIWIYLSTLYRIAVGTKIVPLYKEDDIDTGNIVDTSTEEGKMIQGAIDKISNNIDPEQDPQTQILQLVSSGGLKDLMNGFSGGNVKSKNLKKIANNLLNMIGDDDDEDDVKDTKVEKKGKEGVPSKEIKNSS